MSDSRSNPSFLNQFISVTAILGCFMIFGLLLYWNYLPNRPEGFPVGSVPPEERAERLSKLRADEDRLTNHYSWIDQDKGTVRLPIERGMELVLQELSGKSSD
jgi:hypothetical protein